MGVVDWKFGRNDKREKKRIFPIVNNNCMERDIHVITTFRRTNVLLDDNFTAACDKTEKETVKCWR